MVEIQYGATLYQCHTRKRGVLNFNPKSSARFNAPNGEFGVTYLSLSPEGAFAEKFFQDGILRYQNTLWPILDRTSIDNHCLCEVNFADPALRPNLRLVNLVGSLVHLGADGRLGSMTDQPTLTQNWSRAFWEHPDSPDGLIYIARHDGTEFSIALYDRANGVLTGSCASNILESDSYLNRLLNKYSIGLFEDKD